MNKKLKIIVSVCFVLASVVFLNFDKIITSTVVSPALAQVDSRTCPATGGTKLEQLGEYCIHTFTVNTPVSDRFFNVPEGTMSADVLVVAGGGGGAGTSGGGGAGGLVYKSGVSLSGSYPVIVGIGGPGGQVYTGANSNGRVGTDSVFGTLFTAKGGGAGQSYYGTPQGNGGSGGGGGYLTSGSPGGTGIQPTQLIDSGTYGFGNGGGTGWDRGNYPGGGGGGSGGVGGDAVNATAEGDYSDAIGGAAGIGKAYDISGASIYYAGGGSGGCRSNCNKGASASGGGTGSYGGGGDSYNETAKLTGDNGGSGIVIIRYRKVFTVPEAPTIGTATAGNAQATVTFTAPAFDGGSAITGYTVTSVEDLSKTVTGSASPITVIGLTNDRSYKFTVTATNETGTGTASAASNSVTPVTITAFATGGIITEATADSVGYSIHTFTVNTPIADRFFNVSEGSVSADVLVVAGGGGAAGIAGGGGAGGLIYKTKVSLTGRTDVTIGTGGAGGAPTADGQAGTDSVLGDLIAKGGGAGQAVWGTPQGDGGSGGGGGYNTINGGSGGAAIQSSYDGAGFGNVGGGGNAVWVPRFWFSPAHWDYGYYPGGGGGGAGGAGGRAVNQYGGGSAGAGVENSISGTSVYYAGGGYGSSRGSYAAGAAALGGGSDSYGGGGNSFRNTTGESGGSGVVIVRYKKTFDIPAAPTIGTATAGNGNVSVTFTPNSDGGKPILKYTVTSDPGNITATGLTSPITAEGLRNDGITYRFSVTATNVIGTSPRSDFSNSVMPRSYYGGGGTLTYTDAKGLNPRTTEPYPDGYTNHTFTAPGGTFEVGRNLIGADIIMCAGGGGGGGNEAGGGGAGGCITKSDWTIDLNDYPITVGTGGGVMESGKNTLFLGLTAIGGGRGGTYTDVGGASGQFYVSCYDGGSGGGGAATQAGCPGTPGQGNSGAREYGGGGGAGGPGSGPSGPSGGAGGLGIQWVDKNWYGAGGHGGSSGSSGGPNTGNGGIGYYGGQNGIVIVRYLSDSNSSIYKHLEFGKVVKYGISGQPLLPEYICSPYVYNTTFTDSVRTPEYINWQGEHGTKAQAIAATIASLESCLNSDSLGKNFQLTQSTVSPAYGFDFPTYSPYKMWGYRGFRTMTGYSWYPYGRRVYAFNGSTRQVDYGAALPEFAHLQTTICNNASWEFCQFHDNTVPTYKAEARGTPSDPINVTISPISHGLQLSWNSSGDGLASSYNIYRGISANNLSLLTSLTAATFVFPDNRFEDPTLTDYYYKITSVNASGEESEGGADTRVDSRNVVWGANTVIINTIRGVGFASDARAFLSQNNIKAQECKPLTVLDSRTIQNAYCDIANVPYGVWDVMVEAGGNTGVLYGAFTIKSFTPAEPSVGISKTNLSDGILQLDWIAGDTIFTSAVAKLSINGIDQICPLGLSNFDYANNRYNNPQSCMLSAEIKNAANGDFSNLTLSITNNIYSSYVPLALLAPLTPFAPLSVPIFYCTVNDSSWTPDPSTVCTGQKFEQTSNCGTRQENVPGTKVPIWSPALTSSTCGTFPQSTTNCSPMRSRSLTSVTVPKTETCASNEVCTNNQCVVCTPSTAECTRTGSACGERSDGCGGMISCGSYGGGCDGNSYCSSGSCHICNCCVDYNGKTKKCNIPGTCNSNGACLTGSIP